MSTKRENWGQTLNIPCVQHPHVSESTVFVDHMVAMAGIILLVPENWKMQKKNTEECCCF